MSLSQRERRNPPPRQKSCAACIKAKRRCDAALPACLRCAQRGIPCVMPARQRGNRSVAGTTAVIPVSAAPPTPPAMYDLGDFMGIALPPTQTGCSGDWDALLSSLEPMLSTTCFDLETSPTFKDFLPGPMEATVYPEQLGIVHQQSTMSAPTSKRFERPPYMVYKKLSYALDEIKKAPSMMVLETQTPWCHPKLYESGMPRSMQGMICTTGVSSSLSEEGDGMLTSLTMRKMHTHPARSTWPRTEPTAQSSSAPSRVG